jgi:hypothetical protein
MSWQWQTDRGHWRCYDDEAHTTLMSARHLKVKKVKLMIGGLQLKVNFEKLQQKNVVTKKKRCIRFIPGTHQHDSKCMPVFHVPRRALTPSNNTNNVGAPMTTTAAATTTMMPGCGPAKENTSGEGRGGGGRISTTTQQQQQLNPLINLQNTTQLEQSATIVAQTQTDDDERSALLYNNE